MSKETTLVEDADAETFEVIKNDVGLDLGRDKNYVFLELAKLKAQLLLSRLRAVIGGIKIMYICSSMVVRIIMQ